MNAPTRHAPRASIALDDPELLASPDKVFAKLRALGPVVWNDAIGMFVVTRYDEVLAALQTPQTFSSRRDVDSGAHLGPPAQAVLRQGYEEKSILVNDDPPGHTRLRALVNRAFTKRAIAELEPLIHKSAEELVSSLGASFDLVESLAAPLPLRVICHVMGAPAADGPRLKEWSKSWAALIHNRSLNHEEQARCAEDVLAWQRYMGELVERRQKDPGDDLPSRLLAARESGLAPLTIGEIVVFCMGLLFAGHETTANLIANTVVQVLRHGLWEQLRQEPADVIKAIEETLRFEPPVQGMIRRAKTDTELGSVPIAAGQQLLLSFASANRDPTRFENPDTFDLQRQCASKHFAFGYGIHFCIGAQLARREAEIAIRLLTASRPTPHLGDELSYRPSLAHRGPIRVSLSGNA